MMNKSKKVKMLSKCYTFLAFTACTILCTSSREAKAVVGGGTGRVGPRVSALARNYGELHSDTIRYGIRQGHGGTGGIGGSNLASSGLSGRGLGASGGSGIVTQSSSGGHKSTLNGLRLSGPPTNDNSRGISKLSLSNTSINNDINSSGTNLRLDSFSSQSGVRSGGSVSSPNFQSASLGITLIRTGGDGTRTVITGRESIQSLVSSGGGFGATRTVNHNSNTLTHIFRD